MPSLSTGIVRSVPMDKAGVGSAVNDTTREVGGAIGIAIVGSVVTSIYRDRLGPALRALPPQLADIAGDNVGKAAAVAGSLGEQSGPFAAAVKQSFVDGAHIGLRVAAALTAIATVVVVARLSDDDN
jgi:hypothetical protein